VEITMWKIAIDRRGLLGAALGAALLSAAPISLHWSSTAAPSLSIDRAHARIGHPLSPGSVAGVNRRVNRRTARRAYYGGGVAAAGAAAASYGVAGVNGGYDTGYSPDYGGGYNNLYSYAPSANTAPAATGPATHAAPAANTTSMNVGGLESNEHSTSALPSLSPELYAACLDRTYGSCPEQ
jgi:hypothetical protein